MEKIEMKCAICSVSLTEKDIVNHSGTDYCQQCMAQHFKTEHSVLLDENRVPQAGKNPEERRAWTYKTQ